MSPAVEPGSPGQPALVKPVSQSVSPGQISPTRLMLLPTPPQSPLVHSTAHTTLPVCWVMSSVAAAGTTAAAHPSPLPSVSAQPADGYFSPGHPVRLVHGGSSHGPGPDRAQAGVQAELGDVSWSPASGGEVERAGRQAGPSPASSPSLKNENTHGVRSESGGTGSHPSFMSAGSHESISGPGNHQALGSTTSSVGNHQSHSSTGNHTPSSQPKLTIRSTPDSPRARGHPNPDQDRQADHTQVHWEPGPPTIPGGRRPDQDRGLPPGPASPRGAALPPHPDRASPLPPGRQGSPRPPTPPSALRSSPGPQDSLLHPWGWAPPWGPPAFPPKGAFALVDTSPPQGRRGGISPLGGRGGGSPLPERLVSQPRPGPAADEEDPTQGFLGILISTTFPHYGASPPPQSLRPPRAPPYGTIVSVRVSASCVNRRPSELMSV